MKKFTFNDSVRDRTRKTKRWLGWLAFCMLFFAGQMSFAQDYYTVGDGTESNGNQEYPAPFGNYYWGAKHQLFVTAAELIDSGIESGDYISSIGFNVIALNSVPTLNNVAVKVFTSTSTDPIATDWVTSGEVAVGVIGSHTPVLGWNQLTLDQGFVWNGTDNLIIESCFNNSGYLIEGNASTEWTNSGLGTATWTRWYRADNGTVCSSTETTNFSTTTRPNIRFGVIDPPTCLNPSGLSATPTSLTEVTLAWNSEGNLFDVEWGPSGFTLGDGTQITGITTTSTSVTVTIDTPYQYYVRQDCTVDNDGYSIWAGPFSFQTGYCIPTSNCSGGARITNFETADAILNIANFTGSATCGITSTGYSNYSNISAAATEDSVILFTVGVGNYPAHVKLWVDWNGNGEFETDELLSESTELTPTGQNYTGSFTVPTGISNGDYRLRVRIVESVTAFTACSAQTYGETEDYTFTVIDPPACMPPSGLGAGVTLSSADLFWTSDGTIFDIEWGLSGFTPTGNPNDATTTGVDSPFTLTELTADTHYQYYVRQDCTNDNDEYSLWAGPYAFYTGYCAATSQWTGDNINSVETSGAIVNISNITNGASPNGYGNFANYAVQHFETGETEFTVTTNYNMNVNIWIDWNNNMVFDTDELVYQSPTQQQTHTATITVPADTPLGDYRIRVRAQWNSPPACGTINYGETEDYTFTVIAPPSCMPPTQLGANINSLTEAELYWTSDGTLFEVEYGEQGFTLGTGITVTDITTNSTTLPDLTQNTYYQYFIRRDCGDGDLSPWTGPYTFYTNYCAATTQWIGDNITSFVTSGGVPTNISNTNSGSSPNGYGDFTDMSVHHFETGQVDFTVTTNWSSLDVNMWIDWNNNMVFDEDELVASFMGSNTYTGSFSIPVGTPVGDYRIRLRAATSWDGPVLPCGTSQYGETEDYTLTVITPPTCMPPTQLGANINSLTEAELFWTSDGTLFEVEYGEQGFTLGTGTSVTGITTNNTTLSDLTPNTYHHYYIRRDCGDGDLSPWIGPYLFYTNYCESTSQYQWDYISSFSTSGAITNITNNSGGFSPNGYGDFTDMVVSHFETGEVSFTVAFNSWFGVNIWIDWNNNMIFEEDEKVYASGINSNISFSGMFSVPVGQAVGDYRMRVRGDNGSSNPSPCGTIFYGETEDYTFTVIPTPTCMPPTQLGANINSLTEAELFWTSDGTLFEVEYGEQGFTLGTGTTVTDITTNNTILSDLTPNTYHHYYVRRDCGDGDLSPWTGPYTFYTNYCPATTQWTGDNISSFETSGAIVNISNTDNGGSPNGYGNFTNYAVQHFETGEAEFIVTTQWSMNVNIWIDWNNNMIFDADELVYQSTNQQQTHTALISIPADTPLGDYRIRIRAGYSWDGNFGGPCGTINYGETEDYTFTVITPPTCLNPSGLSATPTSLTEVTLAWNSEGNLFDVEWGPSGFTLGDGTQITGITTTSTSVTVTIDTPYQYYVRQDCTVDNDGYSIWAGPFSFQTGYCIPTSNCSGGARITNFETADAILNIANFTGSATCGITSTGYSNYSNISAAATEDSVILFTVGVGNYPAHVKLWVDWNGNGEFETDELLSESTELTPTGQNYTGSFTVPTGISNGDYRLRVRIVESVTAFTACSAQTYGETEDYTFTVIDPPACMPPSGLGAGVTLSSADLFWTSDGTIFDIEWGLSGFTPTGNPNDATTTGVDSPFTLTELTADTHYQYYVRQDCTNDNDEYSLWAGPYAFYTGYCAATSQWTGDNINSVETSGAIVNISNITNGASPNGYGNFANYAVQHFETGETEFTVTTNYNMNVNIWIDWNNNMVFDTDELVYQSPTQQQTHTATITVPADTPLGDYRIRVRAQWNSPPACGTINYGETEDYTFTVIAPPSCMPPTQLGANINSLTEAELYWTSDGTLFEVEYGEQGFTLGTGITVTDITTNSTTLPDLTQNTYYQYFIRRDCGDGDLSPWTGPYTFYTNYCAATTQWIGDNITSFVTSGGVPTNISNTNSGSSPNGYGDFTDMSVHHFETGQVDFTVTTNWSSLDVNMWIDWNNNMVFDEDELVASFMGSNTYTGSFSIPVGTPVGDYRIRLRAATSWDGPVLPCGTSQYGETEDYTLTVITPPTCMPPTQLGANINSLTEAELFWTSDGTLFEVEYGEQGFTLGTGTSVTGITTNNTTLSDLTPNTYHHYYIRRDCGDGDLSPWIGPYLFYTNYCESTSQYQWDYISSFSTSGAITNITNNSGGFSPNGYGDFTDMVVSHFETGEVSFTVAFNSWFGVNIWIDWNNNMIFEEDEKVYASGINSNISFSGMFSVPVGQAVGDYRMRVRGDNGSSNPSPCGTIFYGETEDYTFTVIPTPTCMPPTQLGANINSLTEAELFWTSDGTLFEVEYGEQGFTLGTGTTVTDITTNNTILSDLTPNTYHHYYVRRDCGDGDLSPWTGPYTFYTNYCPATTQWTGDNISSFETSGAIVNISNTDNGGSPNGYGNFTNYAVQHFETGEAEFIVTTQWSMNVNIWIDWNNNMIFDADELVYQSTNQQQTHTALISIPADTPLGDYRIRIRAGYSWDGNFGGPCGTINYGETEDYTFTVITPPTCMPPTQLGANINSLTEAELYWTSEGTLFEVEYGMQGFTLGTGTTVTDITTNNTILSDLTPNTYHQYFIRRDCGDGDLSPWTGPFLFYTNYCVATSQWTGYDITSFVTTGGIPFDISNTGSGSSPNGYGNFTDMSVHHFETGQVDFTIATNNTLNVSMWIDWNNNMVFDEDELVASFTGSNTYTGSFLIPIGTPVGDYRIRIRGRATWDGPVTPCGTIGYGETEDYTLTVITPPDCLPPFVPIAVNASATSVLLSWQADGDLFDIEYGPTGFTPGEGITISGVSNPYVLGPLTAGVAYDYYVRQDCNANDDGYSTWNGPVTFTPGVFGGTIPTLLNDNPQVEDIACATSFAIDVPEGQFLASLTVDYIMTSASPALDSHQRSVLYSSTLGMGETAVALPPNPQNYPGVVYYSRSVNFANGATGTIEFELKAWRTEGGSGCGTDLVYVEDGSWVLNATFEDIPTCPNPPASLAYTNITEDSVDLIWTSEEDGTFQVKWGSIGFDIETEGITISEIDGYSHNLSGLDSSIPYDFYVRRDCSDDDQEDFGEWVGPVRFNSGHCIPYATQGFYFTLFNTANAVENVTYSNPGPALGSGYVNTNLIITESAGETFNFTSNYIGGASGLKIWVDWNNNFVFEEDEEVYFLASTNGNKSGAITVPAGTEPGDYRMRARAQQGATANPNACGLIVQGEALDFTLRVPCDVIDAPTGDAVQYFTEGDTLAHLDVTGTGIVWFADEDLENELEETELLVHGTTYYAISTVGDCQSEALAVTAEDMCFDFAAPVGDPVQQFTAGTGATLADLDVTGTGLVWYADEDLTDMLDESTPLVNGTTYYVVSTSEDCQSEALAIEVEEVSSTSDFNSFGFTYYPNPVSELLYLSANTPISEVTVINMLGQQVNVSANHDNTRLDMSGLPTGNYLIKVTIEGVSKNLKIVKK